MERQTGAMLGGQRVVVFKESGLHHWTWALETALEGFKQEAPMGLGLGRLAVCRMGVGRRVFSSLERQPHFSKVLEAPEWGRGTDSGAAVRLPWDAQGCWGLRHRGTVWGPGATVAPGRPGWGGGWSI